MVALLKREVGNLLSRFGLQRVQDHRPHPQGEIDYDSLYADVAKNYPKIMKRLAE